MSPPRIRRFSAWLLVALLAIIAGGGEGLHLLPGASHPVVLGEYALMVGAPRPTVAFDTCCAATCGGNTTGQEPLSGSGDSESCPICKILGISYAAGGPAMLLFWGVQSHRPATPPPCRSIAPPIFYLARAPPAV